MIRAARIAHLAGDTAAELETLRAAVERFPGEIAPLYALLESNRRHPLAAEEHARYRAALFARLDDPESDLPVAALQGIFSGADEEILARTALHIERRLGKAPAERASLLGLLATIQDELGEDAAVAETLARLRELDPSEVLTWDLYRAYVRLERWDDAATVFEQLLSEDLDDQLRPTYVQLLGRAGRLEDQQRQIEIHSAGGLTDPRSAIWLDVLLESAWDLRDAGKDAAARALFERALALDPERDKARARLVYLYGTDTERAELVAAESARWRAEGDPQALFDAGTEKLAAGDATAAVELLRRAAPGLPDTEAAWYNLGMAAYRVEDWETAALAFARSRDLNPERAESYFFRGMALYQLTRCSDSVQDLERALALDIGREQVHYYLASCYRQLGDGAAAQRHERLYAESTEQ
jgi:tetratricopeptide (TPR) repeat protein